MSRPKGARDADYEAKRLALLRRITANTMQPGTARPSFRQMAEAGGVSVTTLRHYFGDRAQLMAAILGAYLDEGRKGLEAVTRPPGTFQVSIREYAATLLAALRAPRRARLGDVVAVSLAEGLVDREIGPQTLRHVLDPTLDALARRLDEHVRRGEMIPTDTRAAALMLLSPLLVGFLHQDQLGGDRESPVDLEAAFAQVCDAFVRAYAAPD